MIGIKTGKQIHKRVQRKLGRAKGSNVKIQFLNRRGLKVFVSRSPIHVQYIKMPFVNDYTEKEEQLILRKIDEILSPRRLRKIKLDRRKSYKR